MQRIERAAIPCFPKVQYSAGDELWLYLPPGSNLTNAGVLSMSVGIAQLAEGPGKRTRSSRCFALVQQAEMLALATIDKPLHIATLSRMLAVSERTLRKAFKVTYGLSPCRHLRMLRLLQVREILMSSHDRVVTVTETATCFGFAELGRFSVEYRRVFGESPSATLRRTSCANNTREEARRSQRAKIAEELRSTPIGYG